jgi:hypothetical protein
MKWFDKWFFRKCKEALDNEMSPDESQHSEDYIPKGIRRKNSTIMGSTRVSGVEMSEIQSASTTFKLYTANGGTIIELRRFNEARDQWENALHVVPTGEDFGKSIEHIITYEALKR